MDVYRISLTKWSDTLVASGIGGRWNSKGMRMIYTAENRSLASLENIVHRSSEGLNDLFTVMVIRVPDLLKVKIVNIKSLPVNWNQSNRCMKCREIGDDWLKSYNTVILKVPSAIVKNEFNYLLNPLHQDFKKIKIVRKEVFVFDDRLKK